MPRNPGAPSVFISSTSTSDVVGSTPKTCPKRRGGRHRRNVGQRGTTGGAFPRDCRMAQSRLSSLAYRKRLSSYRFRGQLAPAAKEMADYQLALVPNAAARYRLPRSDRNITPSCIAVRAEPARIAPKENASEREISHADS